MLKQIVIEELKEEDKETVRRVLVESYEQYEPDYTDPQVWKDYRESIVASIDNPNVDKILVAKSGQEVLGSLQLFLSSEDAYQKPELLIFSPIIRLLGVHPEARGRGVAQELIRASVSYAKIKGASQLYLHTSDKMPKAIRLYEWFGFKRDHTKEFQNHDIQVKCYRLDL
ncbi:MULTISPECIES: GNAT family N-acetyltransferase [Bacillaceae]|uniref:GNAT superfamily N-acetyltransferase n=1 Tax=Peribacillus huizhouensis TaxID=1501239 RepID=A0ABR6CMZ5_9BACI|nr:MULTISPECIES: GNAT family N-acetyltransferase [Bacillaceae]MBA9026407.1 GNAT superfamily N-acetyltransferase [Peribacillus huizhouensis]